MDDIERQKIKEELRKLKVRIEEIERKRRGEVK